MIYVKNNTEIQDVFIPRDEAPEAVNPTGGSYKDGFADGRAYQKSLLSSVTITQNGQYKNENGWSGVTVNVDNADYNTGYQNGYTDGVDWRDSQDIPGAFYENGTYRRSNGFGWNEVNVHVNTDAYYNSGVTDGYSSGYTRGYQERGELLGTLNVTQNRTTYTSETGYNEVVVNVGDLSNRLEIELSENGHYEYSGNDFHTLGWENVWVDVHVPQNQGYNDGFRDGFASGTTVGFNSGYTSGVTWRDQQDIPGKFTTNGVYTRQNGYGWNQVTVDVDTASTFNSGFTEGYNSGVTYQKSLLSSKTITQNGNYTTIDGWNDVTVNVPTTNVVTMTKAEYCALSVKDNNTIYLIYG